MTDFCLFLLLVLAPVYPELMKNALSYHLLLLSLLLSFQLQGHESSASFPICPEQTLKTDVTLSVQQQRLIFCYKISGTERVNHGPYARYNLEDQLIEMLWYKDGELTEKSSFSPVPTTVENDENSAITPNQDLSFMRSVVQEIFMRFAPVARQHRGPVAVGGFETRDCLTNNSGLLQFLRGQRPQFAFDFRFHRGRCSLQGQHQLQLNRSHQVRLELNDLRDYRQLEFLLVVAPAIVDEQITQINLSIQQAHLRNPHGGIRFNAEYQLKIDAQGRAQADHQGLLKLTEFRGQKIDQTIALKAPIVPVP